MTILHVGDDGMLHIPGSFLAGAPPHGQFELEVQGNILTLRPADAASSSQRQATPQERAEAFDKWARTSRPNTPDVPDECLRREGLYD
jgi:hypothetical protein